MKEKFFVWWKSLSTNYTNLAKRRSVIAIIVNKVSVNFGGWLKNEFIHYIGKNIMSQKYCPYILYHGERT